MEKTSCTLCRKPKGVLSCGICKQNFCKKCTETLAKDSFSFFGKIPEALTHRTYCGPCYDEKVAPELFEYQSLMQKAKGVFVFVKGQGEETRLLNRNEKPIRVQACADKDETLLRLAFLAVKANFNTLLDVEISSKKLRDEGYQTTLWSGVGIPTRVDKKRFEEKKN